MALLRKYWVVIILVIVIFIIDLIIRISFIIPKPKYDSDGMYTYRNMIEYPLALVDIDDNSDYMLVKESSVHTSMIITDTQAIKENVSAFRVYNYGRLYGTTPEGYFRLYKDGELISLTPYDTCRLYTRRIRYGTLNFQPN